MTDYSKRHPRRPVRKRCALCGQTGYYHQGTRQCRMRKFGAGSYCCWGDLTPVRKPRPKAVPHAGDRFRQRAAKQFTVAQKTLRRWQSRLKRDQKLVHKWELRLAQWERKASYTDEQVEALRQRAAHAGHVQKVRRRLIGTAIKQDGGV